MKSNLHSAILFASLSNLLVFQYAAQAAPPSPSSTNQPPVNKAKHNEHQTNWQKSSLAAGKLIAQNKFAKAKIMLEAILPQARHDDPDSIDLAVCLGRYGIDLYSLQQYPQALPPLEEALAIFESKPDSVRKERSIFQIAATMAAIQIELGKFDQAESLARTSIAYGIAYPIVTSPENMRKGYYVLYEALEKQNKPEEAATVKDIFNSL